MRRIAVAGCVAALSLLFAGISPAQYDTGYPGAGYPGGGYPGGTTGATGKVQLKLKAKKTQKSLKAVKVKATCQNRACTVEAKGKLKSGKKKAKLKPDEESLAAGDTDPMKLRLAKKAKRTAKRAARQDRKLTVKVTAKAKGVGGGGEDSASLKIKLKP